MKKMNGCNNYYSRRGVPNEIVYTSNNVFRS